MQSGKTLDDPNRFRFERHDFYLKSPAEMRALWADKYDLREACDNTLLIAERCSVAFDEVVAPTCRGSRSRTGETEQTWFVKEVEKGLAVRFPDGIPPEVRKQADYEVGVITAMNFPGYFLVVADFINWAKDHGIRVGPGRGSGAGSMVAYAMRITDLNPLVHGLIFERFLNPDRVSMPDFDVDFDERRRGDVIRYVTERYGDDRVAQIVTYGTIKAKQAVKDSARVLGMPFAVGDRITKVMPPPVMGKDVPLAKIFEPSDARYAEGGEFRALFDTDPDVRKVVDTANGLEGLKRQWGVHAAGVIMSSAPLLDLIPIMKREQDGAIITQFDYPTCEKLGLIKMDFLGLRNLTILDDAVGNIQANRGHRAGPGGPAAGRQARRTSCCPAATPSGCSSWTAARMRALLRSMRPDNFEDISAVIALYRPGPMGANSHNEYADRKTGRKPVDADPPGAGARRWQRSAGRHLRADRLPGTGHGDRPAPGRLHPRRGRPAAPGDGQEEEGRAGRPVRDLLGRHGRPRLRPRTRSRRCGTSCCRSPTTRSTRRTRRPTGCCPTGRRTSRPTTRPSTWPRCSPRSATTRTRWPSTWPNAAAWGSRCCRRTSTPSVQNFAPVGTDIRFGLSAVRNVGTGVVASIVACRKDKGAYTDFYDFLDKVDAIVCNKKVVESLIKAGAFDSMGHPRKGLLMDHVRAVDEVLGLKKAEAIGQFDLFGEMTQEEKGDTFRGQVPDTEWDTKLRLGFEREMLGLYVSGHPLAGVEHILSAQSDASIPDMLDGTVPDRGDGHRRRHPDQPAAAADQEGRSVGVGHAGGPGRRRRGGVLPEGLHRVRACCSPRTRSCWSRRGSRGRTTGCRMHAQSVVVPDLSNDPVKGPVQLSIAASRCTPPVVDRLKDVLQAHPGTTAVHLRLLNGSRVHHAQAGRRAPGDPDVRADR